MITLLLAAGSPALQHRAAVWLGALVSCDADALFGRRADNGHDAPTHALTLAAALTLCARANAGPAPGLAVALLRDAERRRGSTLPLPPAEALEALVAQCRQDAHDRACAADQREADAARARAEQAAAEREAREAEMKARAAEHRRRQQAEDRQSQKWAGQIDSDDDDDDEDE